MQDNNKNLKQETSLEQEIEKESPLEIANSKIVELEVKITDLNDKLLRTLAELDNVRRRSREDVEKASKYSISNFVSDLVVVAENFFLASENAPKSEIEQNQAIKNYADAIVMTEKELLKILEKNQVKRIYPLNQKFDHNFHEAISQVTPPENSNFQVGDILQVIQAGYSIGDRLIRPALVVVAS